MVEVIFRGETPSSQLYIRGLTPEQAISSF